MGYNELFYTRKSEKVFLEIFNGNFNNVEYYKLKVTVDDYEAEGVTSVGITVPHTYTEVCYGLFGEKRIKRNGLMVRNFGIYAIRNEKGLYEMITGKKVGIYGQDAELYCYGVKKEADLSKIGADLEFLDSNPTYKKEYIKLLLSASNSVCAGRKKIDNEEKAKQQKEESAIQYVKSYKIPRS